MKCNSLVTFLFVLLAYSDLVQCFRILGLFTTPVQSHLQTHMAIVKGLVKRGHNVTVVTSLPVNSPEGTYRHIHLDMSENRDEYMKLVGESTTNLEFFNVLDLYKCLTRHAAACLQHSAMKKLMMEEDKEQYDLVIVGYILNEVQLGIASHFKCPVVVVWVNQLFRSVSNLVGNPNELSYVPSIWTHARQPMSFLERVRNHVVGVAEVARDWYLFYYASYYYRQSFPQDIYPSYSEVLRNVSLVMINHHFTQNLVSPNVPAIVEIGGVQIKEKSDPLPENIQKFLDSASIDGAIYFSLGTNGKAFDLGQKAIEGVYKVFSTIPQKIIWKWEFNQYPGNSSNILFSKWLPQDDILAHRNLRLFVTHGGLGSVTETRYHGVPIIAIPLFGDQYGNVKVAEEGGWGRIVDFRTLTEDNFRHAIMDVLENPKYMENVRRISKLYRDRPMTAIQTAMFWIEYVIRHRGAPHIQSPAVHMNFISYNSLDVLAVILGGLLTLYLVLKYVLKVLCNILVRLWNVKVKSD